MDQLRVGQKIILIGALVAVLLSSVAIVSWIAFATLRDHVDAVRDTRVPNAIVAKDMQMQVVQIQQWLTDISATRGQDGLDDGFKEAEAALGTFRNDLAALRRAAQTDTDGQGLARLQQLEERMGVWYATGRKMAQAYIDGGPAAGNKLMAGFDKASKELQDALQPVLEAQLEGARSGLESASAEIAWVQSVTLAGMASVLLLLAGAGVLLVRKIAVPLNDMSGLMQRMVATRDFSGHLDVRGKDEIAQATESFNRLLAMMREVFGALGDNLRHLDTTAGDLSRTVEQSSQSSALTSDSAASIAASVEELSASIDQMRDNTVATQDIVADAARHTDDGGRVIEAAVAEMKRIHGAVGEVAEMINSLGQHSERISSVIAVIREVADQTNLLALNAAIEAARAGEQGRGFAVVADEVRKLAERTSTATGDIAATVGAIRDSSSHAIERISRVVHEAETGARLAGQAGEAIGAIRSGTLQIEHSFREVASGIQEQSVAGQTISQGVEQLAHASEENSMATRQTASAAQALEALSRDIRQRIEQFRI